MSDLTDTNTFWNWSGGYVGYRLTDCLFCDDGHQIGYFAEGDEIYGRNGEYMGEVRAGNRLITNQKKKKWTRGSFVPRSLKCSPGHPNLGARDMIVGFEDFPNSRPANVSVDPDKYAPRSVEKEQHSKS